ncbi:DUF5606 domain-containing protein [Flavobacterium psychrophilum]|uniref:DUF5606 domain-containing protein n=1 Tax=Flavobacterium psychrophilum TaxID=96345 RepID=A0A226J7A3_FLAPS|nr:DUF5606 domain-containing protein [Flavobacterium psychrophilum]AIN74469.1 hypothetical protein FPG3_09275 [Flavobacterium psychrophilum FPG3]EKT2068397.1 DUF5606 domain-containing protein [Flavobacterium psychrophilum]EKT2071475.1 DUF5606 domain-containing protein [Flavobacterium psychrophilum]EKT3963434.1 DUF5606 domain-containing protein [Flavobacterium psychrophilum]EKT3965103.1 DUF5606 domain-containing protein [Flavobacterium psychrophilum]
MNLEKILAISGKPGLYALKVQTRTGFVAESFIDGKRITVGLRSNVSLLSEVSIYTTSDEKPLVDVMRNIAKKENNGPTPVFKDDKVQLAAYFLEVLPDYDQERVYGSDIKKVLNWYNILQARGLVSSEESQITEEKTEKVVVSTEAKPAKATKTVAPKNAGMAAAKKAPAQKATKSTKK